MLQVVEWQVGSTPFTTVQVPAVYGLSPLIRGP